MLLFGQAPRTITIALALATAAQLNQILRYEFSLSDTGGAEILDRLSEQSETYSAECVIH
jgi:GTPase SAR1 family protein